MDKNKKKIVLLNACKGLYGGVESFLLNVFRGLDKNLFEVYFLTCGRSTYDMYKDEIENNGGKVECINIYPGDIKTEIAVYKELEKYFLRINPDIVHINSSALSFQLLASKAAYKSGVKSRILHSHNFVPNANPRKEKIKSLLKPILTKYGTRYLACSLGAARWMFEDKIMNSVVVIPNGINTEEFRFSDEKRAKFRNEFNLSEDTVMVGNIGRFQRQKNHFFMIDIFECYVRKNPNTVLLLAGEGELKQAVIEYVQEKNLSSRVVFLGERNDMGYFFSAMDIFILPSLFEGLPIAALEAQASGVKVFLSDTITRETNATGRIKFLPIDNTTVWADEMSNCVSDENRYECADLIIQAGYDKTISAERMQEIYLGR